MSGDIKADLIKQLKNLSAGVEQLSRRTIAFCLIVTGCCIALSFWLPWHWILLIVLGYIGISIADGVVALSSAIIAHAGVTTTRDVMILTEQQNYAEKSRRRAEEFNRRAQGGGR